MYNRTAEGHIEFSQPCPYDMYIDTTGDDNGDYIDFNVPAGTTYYEFILNDRVFYQSSSVYVSLFDPYDTNYRIIPTHIHAVYAPDYFEYNRELATYLYTTNINHIPVSDDYLGTNYEICPIKELFDLFEPIIWYNYNGEIVFRNLYTDDFIYAYALNSFGNFYLWN